MILEDGNVFTGTSIGSTREVISEIVFNTSMTGYLEVLTDPSLCGTGSCDDLSADWKLRNHAGYGVGTAVAGRLYCEGTVQNAEQFPVRGDDSGFSRKIRYSGIAGIDTRALTKILREKGTMNGMITTNENYNIEEIIP